MLPVKTTDTSDGAEDKIEELLKGDIDESVIEDIRKYMEEQKTIKKNKISMNIENVNILH